MDLGKRTVNLDKETERRVLEVVGDVEWDGFLKQAIDHEVRRHEIGRKLSEAVAEAEASGEPIRTTGPEMAERLRGLP